METTNAQSQPNTDQAPATNGLTTNTPRTHTEFNEQMESDDTSDVGHGGSFLVSKKRRKMPDGEGSASFGQHDSGLNRTTVQAPSDSFLKLRRHK